MLGEHVLWESEVVRQMGVEMKLHTGWPITGKMNMDMKAKGDKELAPSGWWRQKSLEILHLSHPNFLRRGIKMFSSVPRIISTIGAGVLPGTGLRALLMLSIRRCKSTFKPRKVIQRPKLQRRPQILPLDKNSWRLWNIRLYGRLQRRTSKDRKKKHLS